MKTGIIAGMTLLSERLTSMKTYVLRTVQSVLSGITLNLLWRSSLVGTATGISDYVWASYIATISDANAFAAANWSVLVIILGAFIVVSYVNDRRLILPAAIGAWVGTYLAI